MREGRLRPVVSFQPYSEEELVDASRQTEIFPPGICERIEATIVHRLILDSEISKIRQLGSNGALIASVLAFIQGRVANVHSITLVLPILSLARRPHQHGCIDRLLNVCKVSQFECSKTDPATRLALTSAIKDAFAKEGEIAEAAMLLLDLRGYLTGEESQRFFDYVVQYPYMSDVEILNAIARWLVSIKNQHPEHLAETVRAIQNSLATVAEKKPDKFGPRFEEATIWIMLALGFWLLSEEQHTAATTVFWRGWKRLVQVGGSDSIRPLAEAFEILEPLLSNVDAGLLTAAVQSGQTDSDPFVRASFVILNAFAGEKRN